MTLSPLLFALVSVLTGCATLDEGKAIDEAEEARLKPILLDAEKVGFYANTASAHTGPIKTLLLMLQRFAEVQGDEGYEEIDMLVKAYDTSEQAYDEYGFSTRVWNLVRRKLSPEELRYVAEILSDNNVGACRQKRKF